MMARASSDPTDHPRAFQHGFESAVQIHGQLPSRFSPATPSSLTSLSGTRGTTEGSLYIRLMLSPHFSPACCSDDRYASTCFVALCSVYALRGYDETSGLLDVLQRIRLWGPSRDHAACESRSAALTRLRDWHVERDSRGSRKPSSLRPPWLRRTGAAATFSGVSRRNPVRKAG